MRKLLLLVLLLSCLQAISQDKEYKGLIKLYPLNLIGGHINAGYEYVLNSNTSLELNGSYYYQDIFMQGIDELDYKKFEVSGFAARLTYRGYFSEEAPSGGYLAPQIMFKSITSVPRGRYFGPLIDSVIFHRNIYAFKVLAGYQLKLFHNFFLDMYSGVGIRLLTGWKDTYYRSVKIYNTEQWHEEIPAGKSVILSGDQPPVSFHVGFSLSIAL